MSLRRVAHALDVRSYIWLHLSRDFNRFRLSGSDRTRALCTGPSHREAAFLALLDKDLLLASHDIVLAEMSKILPLPNRLLDDADNFSTECEVIICVKIDRIVIEG